MLDDSNLLSVELFNVTEGTNIKTLEEISEVVPHISALERSLVVCVLQESTDKLNILKHLLPCPNKQWDENYMSLPDRFMHNKKINEVISDKSKEGDLSMPIKVQRCR